MRSLQLSALLMLAVAGCSKPQPAQEQVQPAQPPPVVAAPASLRPTGRVTDAAHLLTPGEQVQLYKKLERFEQSTKHQMAVVTVDSLNGQDISVFTRELGNRWGIGRRGVNDGIIILVAPKEHEARIAVGLGLEKALPDASCKAIMDQQMIPLFRRRDFAGGLNAGVDAIAARLRA